MIFIGVSYRDRRIYMPKPASWPEMLEKVSQSFGLDDAQINQLRVLYRPNIYDESCNLWELYPEAWQGVENGTSIHLEVSSGDEASSCHLQRDQSMGTMMDLGDVESDVELSDMAAQDDPVNVVIKMMSGRRTRFQPKLSTTVRQLKALFQAKEGVQPKDLKLIFRGRTMLDDMRLDECGVTEGAELHGVVTLRGAKPAIYLMPPHVRKGEVVAVDVTLCPEWRFITLYPPAEVLNDVDETGSKETTVCWQVGLEADGTFQDEASELECSYLFWEAESLPLRDISPSSLVEASLDVFNPAIPHPFLQHAHEVLPFEKVVDRLNHVLRGFHLTVAMRTEFMVYWIPAFQRIRDRGQHIKFSFVPQAAFEKAARIDIISGYKETVRGRVFMLFSGVDASLADDSRTVPISWVTYAWKYHMKHSMKNKKLLRVLEWGGMEVHE